MSKDYNKVPVKNNMNVESEVDNNNEEVVQTEKKQLAKVVDVQPKKVKRSLVGRLVTGVLGPEGLPGIGSYVNEEIIKPALKNIVFDALTSAARMALFKDGGAPHRGSNHRSSSSGYRPTTNYNSVHRSSHAEPRDRVAPRGPRHGVEEYRFDYREDAAHVLVSLTEAADMYDKVSIADYYDLIGVDSVNYTDNNFGWTIDSITRATIMPVRGGYIIKFPQVEVI